MRYSNGTEKCRGYVLRFLLCFFAGFFVLPCFAGCIEVGSTAKVDDNGSSLGVAWGDYNNDNLLDRAIAFRIL